VRQVIYRHKDFPKNFHPLGDREFLVRAAAKNLEKSLRKRVCPFANHGTLPLHGELSGQVGGQNLAKNQKSVQSEASALKEPTARSCMVGMQRCGNGGIARRGRKKGAVMQRLHGT
jgi:hypothetical protein